ncbi:hypothetical protein H0H87_010148 [Tephrocybe sp. NHM501043]|nr:hypothetical protein H0H87_010148 [Tephrocybe sp. NHM501043]
MSTRLFADYPFENHSLREFIERALSLYYPDLDNSDFIRLVLTGEYEDMESKKLAFVDPIQNLVSPDASLNIQRDYDSLLGISDDILVTGDMSVFAVPHANFALKSSIHIKYPIIWQGVENKSTPHKIPNFELGSFGQRSQINVFSPKLWSPVRAKTIKPWNLTDGERDIFYTRGFRPAVVTLLGQEFVSSWPATIETEEFRARRSKGGYSFATKMLPGYIVEELAGVVRGELHDSHDILDADLEWASTFFILHIIRGVKQVTFHRVNPESASFYLRDFLFNNHLSAEIWHEGRWYINVAIEITSNEGNCLQWMSHTHHEVVRQALNITHNQATRITSTTSSKYSRDLAGHLTAVSGFRIIPGVWAQGPYMAQYIQAYTTDKSVLYNHDRGHRAKFLTTEEAMGRSHPTRSIEGIHAIYKEASKKNASHPRLEVRVPLEFADTVLLEFDPRGLRRCLCEFPRKE